MTRAASSTAICWTISCPPRWTTRSSTPSSWRPTTPRGPLGTNPWESRRPFLWPIRNAVLQATGVGLRRLPMNPQRLVEAFTEAGLIEKVGD